uniref:Pentatricopeptide repeat-containing protein n=1 Tax=Kalanchoe fedtschenkoi TaxID=63787 RepID=A0A7N0V880_KALFE
MVRRMIGEGERPDGYTFSMVLKASTCESSGFSAGGVAKEVHAQVLRAGVEPDDVLCTALVNSYVKGGEMRYARGVFDSVLEKNVVCSTSIISGYMNEGLVEEAEYIFGRTVAKDVVAFNAMIEGYSKKVESARKGIDVFVDMLRFGFRPTLSTFASVIGACSVLAAVEAGQQVQSQLIKANLSGDIQMGSALVDMFSKCGKIEEARQVFDQMCDRNVYTWTSMIDGYGKNGNPSKALELFSKMQRECLTAPNDVTFLSAISACGHAGLVTRGMSIFESMEKDYSIKPGMEHYACMVDLIGRAGGLHRAWEFIQSMPEKPNADVWAALLSSCRLHGDVAMADLAANELFKLNADGNPRPGAYVALSNTLAEHGKWDNASEIRELMKVKQIAKGTGHLIV